MPSRAEHLEDIRARLAGKIPTIGDKVWRSRTKTIPPERLPAICLYAPDEKSGDALAVGAQAQYLPTHTLCIEIRVPEADGFDLGAGLITEAVKQILFKDADWTKRFKPHPVFAVKQFLERRGEESFCGEVLTLTVTDRRPHEYRPLADTLSAIVTAFDLDGDGTTDLTLNQENAP